MFDKASLLTTLAREMARQEPGLPLASRLCSSAVTVLGVDGASITLAYTAADRVTLCSTDETAARLEDWQEVLGQGPGPQAYETGLQLRVGIDGGDDVRWPEFAYAVHRGLGAIQLAAIPIRPDQEVLGVLTCHLPRERLITLAEPEAQFLADAVGVALLRDPQAAETDMEGPWATRAQIHQATGMVVAQLRLGLDDALALLRAHAFAHDTTVAEIAAQVVERTLDFRYDDTANGKES
jgi:hypothetical protein